MAIPAAFYEVTLNYSGPTASGKAATVFGIEDGGEADPAIAAGEIAVAWVAELKPITHNSFRLDNVTVKSFASVGIATETEAIGNRTGDLAPPNVSPLIRKLSSLRGRKNQGRMYLPGLLLDGDIFDDGTLSSGALTSIDGAATNFFNALDALGHQMVILHPSLDDAPTVVTGVQCEPLVATQRRRLR